MADGYGPSLPLTFGDETDGYAMKKTLIEETKQNFKILLLTSPGERIMLPKFGIGIKKYLFEQQSERTYINIRKNINKQVRRYLPHVEIQKVEFGGENQPYAEQPSAIDSNHLSLRITYKILTLDAIDRIEFEEASI